MNDIDTIYTLTMDELRALALAWCAWKKEQGA